MVMVAPTPGVEDALTLDPFSIGNMTVHYLTATQGAHVRTYLQVTLGYQIQNDILNFFFFWRSPAP